MTAAIRGYFEGDFGAEAFFGLRDSRFWTCFSAMITS